MSEHEKYEQVGRLAEEYSKLKGELNHVTERIQSSREGYQIAGQAINQNALILSEGKLVVNRNMGIQGNLANVNHMLSSRELIEAFEARSRLTKEVGECAERLRALAPHLV